MPLAPTTRLGSYEIQAERTADRIGRNRCGSSPLNVASHGTQPNTSDAVVSNGALARKRSWRIGFFTVMPGMLVLLVVAGFTRTLFARPVFHADPIPPYLYVHGIVLTCWFVWALVQSLLISAGRVANHRRFGSLGACFAAAVFVAALMASFGVVSRKGLDLNADASAIGIGVYGNHRRGFLLTGRLGQYRQCPQLRRIFGSRRDSSAPSSGPQALDATGVDQHHRTGPGTNCPMANVRWRTRPVCPCRKEGASAAGHERVAADLGYRCRAGLGHHHLQLAAQQRDDRLHTLLAE